VLGPPAKRRRWPWTAAAFVLATVLGWVGLLAVLGPDMAENAPGAAKAADSPTGQLGRPIRDSMFEFTVAGLDCTKTTVGADFAVGVARGTYCMVTLSVQNTGTQAQPFDESSQKVYDDKGTAYSHDTDAEFIVNSDTPAWFEQIGPGSRVTGKLVFDVPEPARLSVIELHDSPNSGGVKVALH
jgi:hypothetical protein